MARPYWSGKIQISLVSFGVKLFVATEAASDIHFHMIDRRTGERVKHQNVASSAIERNPDEAADPVHKSDIVKGYEYSHGRYVTIEPDELAHLRVPSKRTMDVTQFVDVSSIEPAFFEKPYFVVPEDDSQTEAFLTIRQALIDTNKVALSRIAFGGREHLVAIAVPRDESARGLMAYTLRYTEELRKPEEYFSRIDNASVDKRQLSMASDLIKAYSGPFRADEFKDDYETALRSLVEAKENEMPLPLGDEKPRQAKVVGLMDALRRSLNEARAPHPGRKKPPHREKAPAAAKKGPVLVKPIRRRHRAA